MMRNRLILALVLASSALDHSTAQESPTPRSVLENGAVSVSRYALAPGARLQPRPHAFVAVVIQLSAGDVELTSGTDRSSRGNEAGHSWFIAKGAEYTVINRGAAACDLMVVAAKQPMSPRSNAPVPATPVPAGISRTALIENDESRVVRVRFDPGAREELHSHAFDLLVVQLTPGRVETRLGEETTAKDLERADVIFLPKDVPHAVGNSGRAPYEILSVAIK